MRVTHQVNINVSFHWDAVQFGMILDLLERGKEDPAKLTAVTDDLKASQTALSDAVTGNTIQP
jgi:hypothetical protein